MESGRITCKLKGEIEAPWFNDIDVDEIGFWSEDVDLPFPSAAKDRLSVSLVSS